MAIAADALQVVPLRSQRIINPIERPDMIDFGCGPDATDFAHWLFRSLHLADLLPRVIISTVATVAVAISH